MYTNTKILSAYIMYRLYFVKLDDRKKSDDSSSDIYLGIKSEVESSEGMWNYSDIYLAPFWWIKYR